MKPADVLVVVPAHNEADTIGACLSSVCAALDLARSVGAVGQVRLAVGLHRCSDDTATRVQEVLARHPQLPATVLVENARLSVGQVRTRVVTRAVEDSRSDEQQVDSDTWVFSTDADSSVPPDWIVSTLRQRCRSRADLILGLVELADWQVDEAAWGAYERIIGSGITATGHTHAYAANLAVRLRVFLAVGGFPDVPSGEEHALAAAVRAAGYRVVSTASPRVQTSARMPGRASAGLGALLADLAAGGSRRERAEADATDTDALEIGALRTGALETDAAEADHPYPKVLP